MSKRIEGSEIHKIIGPVYDLTHEQVAEAQRKASDREKDREWVRWIDENGAQFVNDEMEAIEHKGFLEIDWSIWQAKRQKIENE